MRKPFIEFSTADLQDINRRTIEKLRVQQVTSQSASSGATLPPTAAPDGTWLEAVQRAWAHAFRKSVATAPTSAPADWDETFAPIRRLTREELRDAFIAASKKSQ